MNKIEFVFSSSLLSFTNERICDFKKRVNEFGAPT